MISAGGAVENPTRVREIRKTIAQLLTVRMRRNLVLEKPQPKTPKKTEAKRQSLPSQR